MAVSFLHHADYPATIALLDRLVAGRNGYRAVDTGREVDWDTVRSSMSSTQQSTLDAVRALFRLESTGPPPSEWWRPFTEYVAGM
jgi:hypothetical protein